MKKFTIHRIFSYSSVILIILVLRIADLLITYHYTPDLSFEFNPLVSIFGAKWFAFIVLQLIIVTFISFVIYFYFFQERNKIDRKGLSFLDFMYCYFNGELKPLHARFAFFPKHVKRHLAFNGFILMVLSIGVSIFAIIHNLLLVHQTVWYEQLIMCHHIAVFSSLLGGAVVASAIIFALMEYSRYKKADIDENVVNRCAKEIF
jgi:hypothetical protein